MKAFLFSPSNQFKDKINVASLEEVKIFLTNDKAEPHDYIECDGKTWTILSGSDGLELAEGKIPRGTTAPAISSGSEPKSSNSSIEHKLDRLYDVMNHIRWIGLSIGCMFALTFIVPQCTGS